MKHTPGPWELTPPYHGEYQILCGEEAIQGNCYCHQAFDFDLRYLEGETLEEAEANLRLMAAAPKLLEVLDWLLHLAHGCSKGGQDCPVTAEEWTDAWGEAKAAIAEAKGETQ